MAEFNAVLGKPGSPQNQRVGAPFAYTVIIASTIIFFFIGILVGKTFFWENWDKRADVEKKLEIAQQKVQANAKNPQAHVDYGWALLQNNKFNDAVNEFKNAINIDKNFFPAYFNLGLAYMQVKKYDLATDSFKKALAIQSKSPQARLNLGIAYREMGKYDAAMKELKTAYEGNRGSVDVIIEIGKTYEKLGKKQEALYQYQSALTFSPGDKTVQAAIQRLTGQNK